MQIMEKEKKKNQIQRGFAMRKTRYAHRRTVRCPLYNCTIVCEKKNTKRFMSPKDMKT